MSAPEPGPLPWERQAGEGEKAFQAFATYRDLGPGERSVTRVAKTLGKGVRLPTRWSSRWLWVERARAFDAENDRLRLSRRRAQAEKEDEDEGVALNAAFARALAAVNSLQPKDLKGNQSIAALVEVVKMRRLRRGEPGERHRLDVHPSGDESYERELEEAVADLVARIRRGEAPLPQMPPPPPAGELPAPEGPDEDPSAVHDRLSAEASPETN
jgi:hypothetical protein